MATTKILSFKSISSKIRFATNILGKNHQVIMRRFTTNNPKEICLPATNHFATNILNKNHLAVAKCFSCQYFWQESLSDR
jgi:hypothetical protein